MMQKKGDLTDILVLVITVFILAIGMFVIMYILPSISGGLRTAGMNNTAEGVSAISQLESIGTTTINYGFLLLFVGMQIGLFISSFFIRSHPIFIFLYIFFLALSLLLAIYIGNAYQLLIHNEAFAGMMDTATFPNLIMGHILMLTLVTGVLSIIIIFAKFSTFGGTQQF